MKKPALRTPSPDAFELETFLPYRLSIAANAVSRRIAGAYAEEFGLTIPEWRLIAVLSARGDATQQDLVRATLMDKVAVSRAARTLALRGLIVRAEDRTDARARRLTLTRNGKSLFAQIAPVARRHEDAILAPLTANEVAQLHALLRRIEAAAQAE